MRRAVWLFGSGAVLMALAIAIGGKASLGRALLEFGLPDIAASLLSTPRERGIALHRAGRFAAAANEFEAAGEDYNQALAAAWAGDYATALVAWERVMAANPDDHEARANHKLVSSLLVGTEFDAVARPEDTDDQGAAALANTGQGNARATSTGDEANSEKTGFWMPELTSEGLRRVPYFFDAQFVAANDRWLATLEDQPGIYLRDRLAAEQKQRETNGSALPVPEDAQ